jgi:hypothetical protein
MGIGESEVEFSTVLAKEPELSSPLLIPTLAEGSHPLQSKLPKRELAVLRPEESTLKSEAVSDVGMAAYVVGSFGLRNGRSLSNRSDTGE